MPPLKDLTGQKFGQLTVLKRLEYSKTAHCYYWLCKCECGKKCKVGTNNLKSGHTKSCGCLKNRTTHNESKKQIYKLYYNIKARCYNPNNPAYKNYGGRGIKMCDEWKNDFTLFSKWLKSVKYKQGLTIDRIDVDGNYCPENCKLSTMMEQSNNKRNNHYETYNGETHTISEWARILKINRSTLFNRLTRHTFIEAINL